MEGEAPPMEDAKREARAMAELDVRLARGFRLGHAPVRSFRDDKGRVVCVLHGFKTGTVQMKPTPGLSPHDEEDDATERIETFLGALVKGGAFGDGERQYEAVVGHDFDA